MYQVTRTVISKNNKLYAYFDEYAHSACNLYNAALFRIRQVFTGYDKTLRSANEESVFSEVAMLTERYPAIKVGRVISYSHLEKLLRVTVNPDFFAGLPMQTAQAVVKSACSDFNNWLKALAAYKKEPSKFLGRPKMPGYKKPGSAITFTITNQDTVIYDNSLKLPKMSERLSLGGLSSDARLMECKVKPYYGRYLLCLTFEIADPVVNADMPNLAAIDFGVNNIAALVCTDQSSRLYKGGAVLSENQLFAKRKAKAVSDITRGHEMKYCPTSKRMQDISFHHANFNSDQCHKISRDIISYCIKHRVGTLVLGVNKLWKQAANIGAQNNQSFVAMPTTRLREMITYKAASAGINIILQEESYTSKADFLSGDYIPTYGVDDENAVFSGRRICRGLYRSRTGAVINADFNGAANILRKAIPDVWKGISDFAFLNYPEVSGFHELNPKSIPIKRIAAA